MEEKKEGRKEEEEVRKEGNEVSKRREGRTQYRKKSGMKSRTGREIEFEAGYLTV